MSQLTGNVDDFGMDSGSLAGPLAGKLRAMREAGFGRVMLQAADLAGHPGGVEAAVAEVRASGLRVCGFEVLRDFEGLAGALHDYKVDVAKAMLEMARAVGAPVLVATSSTSVHATDDLEAIARDLRKLAMLAIPMGIRIAFTGSSWGRTISGLLAAWDAVLRADTPNLGLAIDAFHLLAAGTPAEDMDELDPSKVFLVQLADFMGQQASDPAESGAAGRRLRVFPGEGVHTAELADLVKRLDALGYRGDYSFAVYNDDYRQIPPVAVAARARRSALWLGEEVLRRSVPLPNRMRLRPPA